MGLNTDGEEMSPGSNVPYGLESTEKNCGCEQQPGSKNSLPEDTSCDTKIQDQNPCLPLPTSDLPFNIETQWADGTGLQPIFPMYNMPQRHASNTLNTDHNEAEEQHRNARDSALSGKSQQLHSDTVGDTSEPVQGTRRPPNTNPSFLKERVCPPTPAEIFRLLDLKKNDDWDAMYETLREEMQTCDSGMTKRDLHINPDIDVTNVEGYTPLYHSALKGNLRSVDLIPQGANSDKPGNAAAQKGHGDIVDYLILQGADVNVECEMGQTPLHTAAQTGHANTMENLIRQGTDVNKGNHNGLTPFSAAIRYGKMKADKYRIRRGAEEIKYNGMTQLYAVAQFGHLDLVKFFISKGADVNEEEDEGVIPLHSAATGGHMKVMEYLIQQGSDVKKDDHKGGTPFNAAVQNGHLEAVKYLIAKEVKQNRYDGMSSIYAAAQFGHLDLIKYFLSEGCNVNEENDSGRIPLHGAATGGHMKVMEYLIQQGSDVNKGDHKGWTPFSAAVEYGQIDAVKYLIAEGAKQSKYGGMSRLYAAAQSGHLDLVKFFISEGAYVNEENDSGRIPLHGAVTRGHMKVIEYLIQQGSDVNKGSHQGWTPFNAAVEYGQVEAVKYLMAKGAKQNRYDGMPALYAAARSGHLDLVKFFISEGAGVNEEDENGSIPLHVAVARGHFDIMEYLVQQGSDVNKCDIEGWTPFNAAVQYGHLEAVKCLITKGAKQNRYNGMPPLYSAAQFGHLHVVKFFISNGADVNEELDDGRVPLHGAARRGHMEVMEYLIQRGSDVNKYDSKCWTPFNAAVEYGQIEVVKYVIAKEAKQNRYDGMTPLYAAAQFGHLELVKFFISKGAYVNEERDDGQIPLHIAAANGHTEIIKYLVQEGSNVKKKDRMGRTPLHAAVKYGHLEAAECLVTEGLKKYDLMNTTVFFCRDSSVDSKRIFLNEEDNRGQIPLHIAAANGHTEIIKSLIQDGSNVNKKDRMGLTPLHAAVQSGHLEAVECLVTEGPNRYDLMNTVVFFCRNSFVDSKRIFLNEEDNRGQIPLHIAAANGHVEIIKYLVQEGSNVNEKDRTGRTPLHAAVQSGHLEVVKCLMKEGAKQCRYESMTLISLAARFGHLDIAKFFILRDADINEEDNRGQIPLHVAAVNGHMEVIKYLVLEGSDVNKKDGKGWTPLHAAVQFGDLEAVTYLMKEGAKSCRYEGMTPLSLAARFGHLDVVIFFILEGADVNEEDNRGQIPLHVAAANGHTEVIKYLAEEGSDVSKKDGEGKTPFHAAVINGHLEAVKYLMKRTGKRYEYTRNIPLSLAAKSHYSLDIAESSVLRWPVLREEDNQGQIPLHYAAANGHTEVIKYLLQEGSDVNKKDCEGRTPFHAAVQSGHLEAVKYLMSQGAKQWRYEGMTPLSLAVRFGHLDVVIFFILEGADVNDKDNRGQIPLHIAAANGHTEVIKYLVQEGSDVNKKDGEGRTAFDAAVKNGHLEAVIYLMRKGGRQDIYVTETSPSLSARFDVCSGFIRSSVLRWPVLHEEDNQGQIPLHIAAANGHTQVIKYLVEEGSDVNKKDGKGRTPVHAAVQSGHLEAVKYLMAQLPKQNRFGIPWFLYQYELRGLFIPKRTVLHEEDNRGQIPLHYAAANGHTEVIKYLVEEGSDVNKKDGEGRTPVHAAVQSGQLEAVKYLTRKGGKQDRYEKGILLSLATGLGFEDIAEFLISEGANVNEEDNRDQIPPHVAATNGHIEVTKHVVQERSHMKKKKKKKKKHGGGRTPFHAVVPSGDREAVDSFTDKLRTVNNPCSSLLGLVQSIFNMIIALVIILAGNPVLVAGSDITERVTLQAGQPAVIPFDIPRYPDNVSAVFPYFILRFGSKPRPFCINGEDDIEGFKSPSQFPRFTTSVAEMASSICVKVNIDPVDIEDEDLYVLRAFFHGFENLGQETIMKKISVQTPPGPAKCFITISENNNYPYEVHCQATTGSTETTLTCYQYGQRVEVKGDVTDNGQVTKGVFLLPENTRFSCCSHDVTSVVNETMCNDFGWPPYEKSITPARNDHDHVNPVTTSAIGKISRPANGYDQSIPKTSIKSQIESGASRQSMIPSLLPLTYLLMHLVYFVIV